MAKLIYSAITSLDGYIEDPDGNFDWGMPSEEMHAFLNDTTRSIGTSLLGRRMYETLAPWETMDTGPDQPDVIRDFAGLWRTSDKVVYSSTLAEVTTARTRLERSFDAEAVRRMKASSARDLEVGGPGLAAHAFAAGLVDEVHLYVTPVIIGGGKPGLPRGLRQSLALVDQRRFDNGAVFLHYACVR